MKLTENQKRIINTVNKVAEHETGKTYPPAEALAIHDRDWTHSGDAVPFTLWTAGRSQQYAGTASCSPRRKALVDQWDRAGEFEFKTAPHAIKLQDTPAPDNTTPDTTSNNMSTIRTASDLKRHVNHAGHEPYFFTRQTMAFFGDTMRNYGIRQPVMIESNLGDMVPAYELVRKRPVKNDLSDSCWFHAETFKRVFPKN